jgi:hypothetical protein
VSDGPADLLGGGERLASLRALFGRAGWNYSARMTDSEHDGNGTGPAGGGQNWWHQYQQHAVSIDEQILTELRRNNALLERMNARMARGLAYRRSITFDIIGGMLIVVVIVVVAAVAIQAVLL